MPSKKVKKPKKPVQQKQKQKQSQRVVVNVNQPKRAPAKRRQPRQAQQVSYQPIITMSGSVPVQAPMPVQSSGGFTPTTPTQSLGTPIGISAPVVLPTFAEEPVRVIGGEDVSVPILRPVPVPTPIRVPAIRPPARVTGSQVSVSTGSGSSFILPPPSPPSLAVSFPQSDLTLRSEIRRKKKEDYGIQDPRQQELTDAYQKRLDDNRFENDKIREQRLTKQRLAEQFPEESSLSTHSMGTSSGSGSSANEKYKFFTKENMSVAGAPASQPTISTRPSFYEPSVKGGEFTNQPIITAPKEVVVIKKPELKRTDPYSIFSDNESIARAPAIQEDVASDAATQGTYKKPAKPAKKRPVVIGSDTELSDTGANIIPLDKPAGRRLPPVKEKKSSYQSKGDLQQIAKDKKINILRPNGKEKTMNELRLELSG